ncbi:hypothetical protein ACAE71_02993 (plasmid) [Clavibacter nebraskensis]
MYWPAEWAVERPFWREVAARTLAGVFTLVVVGVPALIYAGIARALTPAQIWTIVIGIVLAAVVIVVYIFVLRAFRRGEQRKIDRAKAEEAESLIDAELTAEDRARIQRTRMQTVHKAQRWANVGAIASALLSTAIAALLATRFPSLFSSLFQ